MKTSTVTLLAACVLACAPRPIPVQDFAAEYAAAICGQAARCQTEAPYLQEQCRAQQSAFYGEDVIKAVAAGSIVYDAVAARACVDGVAGTACLAESFTHETTTACLTALKGTVAAGSPCSSFFECAAGFCVAAAYGQCPSTCPETVAEGEACSLRQGPDCDVRAGLRCSAGICVTPVAKDAPCVDNNACQDGLVCAGGVCGRLHKAGEPCSSHEACMTGLYCNASSDEGGGCEARHKAGESCGVDADESGAALSGVQCEDGLACVGAGLTAEGMNVEGVCTRPVGLGGKCTPEAAGMQIQITGCQLGLLCSNGTCATPPTEGPCALHQVCQSGVAFCSGGSTCVLLKANGEPCQLDPECASGLCLDTCQVAVAICHEP